MTKLLLAGVATAAIVAQAAPPAGAVQFFGEVYYQVQSDGYWLQYQYNFTTPERTYTSELYSGPLLRKDFSIPKNTAEGIFLYDVAEGGFVELAVVDEVPLDS